jgi:hypothetical protein
MAPADPVVVPTAASLLEVCCSSPEHPVAHKNESAHRVNGE